MSSEGTTSLFKEGRELCLSSEGMPTQVREGWNRE